MCITSKKSIYILSKLLAQDVYLANYRLFRSLTSYMLRMRYLDQNPRSSALHVFRLDILKEGKPVLSSIKRSSYFYCHLLTDQATRVVSLREILS